MYNNRDNNRDNREGRDGMDDKKSPNRIRRKKTCYFTENKFEFIDYKDERTLRRFLSERGKIIPRRISGTTSKYQRMLAQAIKRARHMAILPFVSDALR
jgi:small subunit ribosomal protein S18